MDNYLKIKALFKRGDNQFETLSDAARKKIDEVKKLLGILSESEQIGTSFDSKTSGNNMKQNIVKLTIALKEASILLDNLEACKMQENKKELMKREIQKLREAYSQEFKKATEIIQNIEKLQKLYVQNVRISIQSREEEQNQSLSFDQDIQTKKQSAQWIQIDIDEAFLREREEDLIELNELLVEMKQLAETQGKCIKDQGEELEMAYENVSQAKENTKAAKKDIQKTEEYKENLVQSE